MSVYTEDEIREKFDLSQEDSDETEIKCLDHGFVRLVDYMGDDHAIARAARVSYQKHDKEKSRKDENLIRYLMKHRHTSPFEMVEFLFHCKMPIFVARQWVRHRTASLNEVSGRYSQLSQERYQPDFERMQPQSKTNKQGSADDQLDHANIAKIQRGMSNETERSFANYQEYIDLGLARELARINLPLSTYTEWYWKMDLHNLFHFLKLRLDSHAQYEIRVYAEAIYKIIKPIVPMACSAFEDYVVNAVTFSKHEYDVIRSYLINAKECIKDDAEARFVLGIMSEREVKDLLAKLEV